MNAALLIVALLAPVWGADAAQSTANGACPTAEDMQILTHLLKRRRMLDTREAALDAREKVLLKLKQETVEKMDVIHAELEKVEARYKLGEPARQMRSKRIETLVDALTGLSAKKAAPMLSAADPDLVGDLLLRMGPTRTAALLAIMAPAKAGKLMEQMGAPGAKRPAGGEKTGDAAAAGRDTPNAATTKPMNTGAQP